MKRVWMRLQQFWTGSIARQLMLGIALVHAVLMTIFVFDLVYRQRAFLIEESTKQATALADTLAANSVSWVLSNDFVGIEEVINSQKSYPGLKYAMLTDLRGRVLGFTDRSMVGKFADDEVSRRLLGAKPAPVVLIDNTHQVDVATPVFSNERHIGWARAGISRKSIADNLALVTNEGLLYTLAAILIGILFGRVMARGLTRDIRRLAEFANHIRSGARNESAHVERPDELGDLARDMQLMLADLRKSETELADVIKQTQTDEERLRFALEGASDGLWDWDLETDEVYMSPRWKSMLGYADHELPSCFASWEDNLHPEDKELALQAVQDKLNNPVGSFEVQTRMRHKDGSWRWILSRAQALVRDGETKPYRMTGTHVDVTEIKQLQETLSAEREKALVTLDSIGDGVITTSADGRVDYLNPVAEALTGWKSGEARGLPLEQVFPIVHELTREAISNPVQRCLREHQVIGLGNHTLLVNRDGREISIEDSAAPILNSQDQVIGVVLVFHDVTESRAMQRQLEHQAAHDDLTGLRSRRSFDQYLTDLTSHALQGDGEHVLVYIDLDQFKIVNDTMGHLAGDEMLKQVATLLQQHVRESDILARLGGDEFGLLLVGCDLERARTLCEQMRSDLSEFRFTWDGQTFQVTASFGLAQINQSMPDPNALALADLACYSAKDSGRNSVHVYYPDDNDLSVRRSEMQWVARIKEALESDRLELYAQRILAIDSQAPEERMEILVRMRDEDGNLVPPSQFIPAAERYGIMDQVDRWVVDKSLEWLLAPGNETSRISVNLSGHSVGNAEILARIEAKLRDHPETHGRLCFEVTETAAIAKLQAAIQFINRLKQFDVEFSLDDFGSGVSSFNYLKTLPVDYVKIDGSFIRDLLDDPVDAAMVEAISHVSRQMGIRTVAEFVESQQLLERVREMGIDFAQGYAIDKPHPLIP